MATLDDFVSFLQGASNSAASNLSAPVDGINWLLGKAGLPVSKAPVGGSAWLRQAGLTAEPKNRNAGLLGEFVGGVMPIVAAAKAPQIAAWLNQAGRNLSAPRTLNHQLGMIKLGHGRIPETYVEANKLRDAIYNQLKKSGNDLSYGDSLVSPSRYVSTSFPPQSSNWANELSVRLSNHGDVNGFNSNPAAGKLSVDPKTGLTFEDAVRWLHSNGYDMGSLLSTANKKYPARDVIPPAYFAEKGK